MRYFATFITGLHEVVEGIFRRSIPDIRVREILDGGICFDTSLEYGEFDINCINNLFEVIDIMSFTHNEAREIEPLYNPIQAHMKSLIKKRNRLPAAMKEVICKRSDQNKSFRIITSHENKLISTVAEIKRNVESLIMEVSGLAVDRSGADAEFWFLYRNEGFCFFMKRLTKHIAYEKILHKGELRPELAYMLNVISDPTADDTVLDAFSGFGSIPVQRLRYFKAKKIYSFDNDRNAVNFQAEKLKSLTGGESIILKRADALKLDMELDRESVDRIVTDPPWGIYTPVNNKVEKDSIISFYQDMLRNFAYVTVKQGIAVILASRSEEHREAICSCVDFNLVKEYQILVSGKKATIYKLIKAE